MATLVAAAALGLLGVSVYAFIFRLIDRQRSLDLVFLQVLIPKKDSKQDREEEGEQFGTGKEFTKVVGLMTQFFLSMHTVRSANWTNYIFDAPFFTCELSVIGGELLFHLGVPRDEANVVEKQITAYYPEAVVQQTPAPNIFAEGAKVSGHYFNLTKPYVYPIRVTQRMESDSLNNIANAFSKIRSGSGAAVQLVCRPIKDNWQEKCLAFAHDMYENKEEKSFFRFLNPFTFLGTLMNFLVHGVRDGDLNIVDDKQMRQVTPIRQERVKALEEKATKSAFDVQIRLVASAPTLAEAKNHLSGLRGAFEQFNAPDMNGLRKSFYHSEKKVIRDYIFRRFCRPLFVTLRRFIRVWEWRQIFSAEEMGTLFHFPNAGYNKSPVIKWQDFKLASAPHNLPEEGLLLGHNVFRGEKREVRIKPGDRMRHFYAIGKSGTGKSTILENMIRQDLQNGQGLCLVDPHGDLVEAVLPHIPRERAEDVIVFDPGDLERPMGLNLLEADTDEQKEFLSQEALAIFIKLYGEEIMGPRLQHYFRNGVLTLMADEEEGATLLDIMRLFTDDEYQMRKRRCLKNKPAVQSFWDREMAKSGAREKEEIIPYFAAKFGPFVTNAQVRNILGQAKSGFDFRKVMDEGKILLCNLSKGKLGDLNAKLLGMIMVSKIQMAAMSRVDTAEKDRRDFYLYVDEFQNFVTDSFASILSEARKYRLGLIIAHQYISQITQSNEGGKGKHEDNTLRDAVFGNVGSMMCFKIGAQDAEVMEKEFQPIFTQQDLINIANYQSYMKLNINGATSRGFSLKTLFDPTGADREAAEAYRQLSRLKFGRDREFVNQEIARRVMI